jgi:hypothetical protein
MKHWCALALAVTALISFARVTRAEDVVVKCQNGEISYVSGGACFQSGALDTSKPECAACWSPTKTLTSGAEACRKQLKLENGGKAVTLVSDGDKLSLAGKPFDMGCSSNASVGVDALTAARKVEDLVVLAKDDKGYWVGTVEEKAPERREEAVACNFGDADHMSIPDTRTERVIEIDLPRKRIVRAPPRMVIPQNTGLIVLVCRAPGEDVTVTWDGARGLVRSHMDRVDGELKSSGVPVSPNVAVLRFPPRKPGDADLTIQGADEKNKMVVELTVEELYWGAVRFGLGTLFDVGDLAHDYELVVFAGSSQMEIRELNTPVAFEVVNGFAPYLFDIAVWGGRSHTNGPNAYVAPFVGFGIVGATTTGTLSALSSFHVGLEVEFSANFSIATTFAMRRTLALADGYHPGSPVAAGASVEGVTEDSWQPGFGIIVNATPDFLQFAIPSTSSSGDDDSGGAADEKEEEPQ